MLSKLHARAAFPRFLASRAGRRTASIQHPPFAEPLEPRLLLAVITFDSGGNDRDLLNPLNWSSDVLPGPGDDARIPAAAGDGLFLSGPLSVRSLQTSARLHLIENASLTSAQPIAASADIELVGGALAAPALTLASGARLRASYSAVPSSFSIPSVAGVIQLAQDASLIASSDLALSGVLNIPTGAVFTFLGDRTLSSGEVLFTHTSFYNPGVLRIDSPDPGAVARLTLAPGVLVHGNSGRIDKGAADGALINDAVIRADVGGGGIAIFGSAEFGVTLINHGTLEAANGGELAAFGLLGSSGHASLAGENSSLTLGGAFALSENFALSSRQTLSLDGFWTNASVITVGDATLNLGGAFTLTGLGSIIRTAGTVNLTGFLNLRGATLSLNAATGPWTLHGGTIRNGTIDLLTPNYLVFTAYGGFFDAVTSRSDLDLIQPFANVTIMNGLSLGSASDPKTLRLFDYASIGFFGEQTFQVGAILLQSQTQAFIGVNSNSAAPAVITFGPNTIVSGGFGLIAVRGAATTLDLQGLIQADVAHRTIDINAEFRVLNHGRLRALNAGTLAVQGLSGPAGDVDIQSGGALELGGDFTLSQSITLSQGTQLTLSGAWRNDAVIHQDGGALNLFGEITLAELGTIVRTSGDTAIGGVLDLQGGALTFSRQTGSWLSLDATFRNGTLNFTEGESLLLQAYAFATTTTFDAITQNGDLTVYGTQTTLRIINGWALHGVVTAFTGAVSFDRNQTLSSGTIRLKSGSVAGENFTLAGSAVIEGVGYASFYGTFRNQSVVRALKAVEYVSPQSLIITATTIMNEGLFSVVDDASLDLTGSSDIGALEYVGVAGSITVRSGVLTGFVNTTPRTIPAGSSLSFVGYFVNAAPITSSGGTLTLGDTNSDDHWSNASTITLTGGVLNLGGTFIRADLGSLVVDDTEINLIGTLDNTGAVLPFNAQTGSWRLKAGRVIGGTLQFSSGFALVPTIVGGVLDGVTVLGDLDLTPFNANIEIRGGLTLHGVATLGPQTSITFTGSQTIASGTFLLADIGYLVFSSGSQPPAVITLEPAVRIVRDQPNDGNTGDNGFIVCYDQSVTLINRGLIEAQGPGVIRVAGDGRFDNQGLVRAAGGGLVEFTSPLDRHTEVLANLHDGRLSGGRWEAIDGVISTPDRIITDLAASILLSGQASDWPELASLRTSAGELTITGGRTQTILLRSGAFTNNGSLTIGPGSALALDGSFVAGTESVITLGVAGDRPSDYGRILVADAALLRGTLHAEFSGVAGNGLQQTFNLISAPGGVFGQFASISAIRNGQPLSVVPTYAANAFRLTTPGVPADPRDLNHDGLVDPDDLADFIAGYFANPRDPRTDFNHDGLINPDDLADYIAAYFR